MALRNQGYCYIPETDMAFYETLNRNEILITMVKGFHDLLVSSEGADVAASLPPHPWDSGGQTKLCFLHISAGFTSPSPLLPAQQVATGCACYMSSHHFQATSPTLPRLPPCGCLQWSADIDLHKNLRCLLKMQIPGSTHREPSAVPLQPGRA